MTEKHAEMLRMHAEKREQRRLKSLVNKERKERKRRQWEEASSEAWKAYRDSQPGGEIPAWVLVNGDCSSAALQDELFETQITLVKKHLFPPEYQYEIGPDGKSSLIRINPKTGQKSYVLTYTPPPEAYVYLFRCTVEFPSKKVMVLLTSDASKLDAAQFDLSCEDLEWCDERVKSLGCEQHP